MTACFPVSYHSSSTHTRLPVGGGGSFLSIRVGEVGKGKAKNEGAARNEIKKKYGKTKAFCVGQPVVLSWALSYVVYLLIRPKKEWAQQLRCCLRPMNFSGHSFQSKTTELYMYSLCMCLYVFCHIFVWHVLVACES